MNRGDNIFETGNKFPNLSGIQGGSRITYNRDFNFIGLEALYLQDKFAFSANLSGVPWRINPGNSRDEDFVMGTITTERGSKMDLARGKVFDTAHTFTGTVNFADGHTRTSMSEYAYDFHLQVYENSANPKPGREDQWFLMLGLKYNYAKYYLYDVMQFINSRPIFYGPIGNGLTYSYSSLELPFGFGYSFNYSSFFVEPSFELLLAYNRFRDFHIQRALNFIGNNFGSGFQYQVNIGYFVFENSILKFNFKGHRQFSDGNFKTSGGLNVNDISSNFLGSFRSYVSTKEVSLGFQFLHRMSH